MLLYLAGNSVRNEPRYARLLATMQRRLVLPTLGTYVEVRRIAGKRVHLAIDVPNDIRICRQELLKRKTLKDPYDASARRPNR
jgi:hypothetical protein